jgi:hypothetical protein
VKFNYTFSRKLKFTVQKFKNYDTYDAEDRDKSMVLLGIKDQTKKLIIQQV